MGPAVRTPLAEMLRRLRARAGYTQRELARRLRGPAGPHPLRALQRWETGAAEPQVHGLARLLQALGASEQEQREALALRRGAGAVRAARTGPAPRVQTRFCPPVGDLLIRFCRRRGLDESSAARAVGVSPRSFRRWEAGGPLSPAHLGRLSQVLALSSPEAAALAEAAAVTPRPYDPAACLEAVEQDLRAVVARADQDDAGVADVGFAVVTDRLLEALRRGRPVLGLLETCCGAHARYLLRRLRGAEALRVVERGEALLSDGRPGAWARLAECRQLAIKMCRGTGASLRYLREVVGWARGDPAAEQGFLRALSERFLDAGSPAEAVAVARPLRELSVPGTNWEDRELADYVYGEALVAAGKVADGLPLLRVPERLPPTDRIHRHIARADAFIALSEFGEAEAEMRSITALIDQTEAWDYREYLEDLGKRMP